jgi:hypothetical protein
MSEAYHRILLLFVDGVGLAPASADNPLATVPAPTLRSLLGGPLTLESVSRREGLVLTPIDANLGVEGRPQSATGQTALFTGVNAPRLLGRHVTGFVGSRLKAILRGGNLFHSARRRGLSVTFANAYRPPRPEDRRRPVSVTTYSLEVAGLPRRGLPELRAGYAVTWDIVRDRFAEGVDGGVDLVEPEEAGGHLAALTSRHRLTVFETFLTDLAGHARFGMEPGEAVRRVDGLLGGLLAAAPEDLTVVLTSDHGNLEDGTQRVHTRNPVPLLAVGPAAHHFVEARTLLDVTPRILACLSGRPPLVPS